MTSRSASAADVGVACPCESPTPTAAQPYPPGWICSTLAGVQHWFTLVTPLPCLPDPSVQQCRPLPSLSGLLPTLPSISSVRLLAASQDFCDSLKGESPTRVRLHGASTRTCTTWNWSVMRTTCSRCPRYRAGSSRRDQSPPLRPRAGAASVPSTISAGQ